MVQNGPLFGPSPGPSWDPLFDRFWLVHPVFTMSFWVFAKPDLAIVAQIPLFQDSGWGPKRVHFGPPFGTPIWLPEARFGFPVAGGVARRVQKGVQKGVQNGSKMGPFWTPFWTPPGQVALVIRWGFGGLGVQKGVQKGVQNGSKIDSKDHLFELRTLI